MTSRGSMTAVILLAAACLMVGAANLVVAQGKGSKPAVIAVVDVQKVFNSLDEKGSVEADITASTEKLQKEEQDRQTELKALQADLNILAPGTPAFADTQEKLEKKAMEFQVWKQFNQNKLERDKAIRLEGLYMKVVGACEAIAKASGYDLVLFKDSTDALKGQNQQQLAALIQVRKVLYSAPDMDITDSVTQKINNEWNNRKK
ncbi:MAG: hypothetical protein GC162_19990 [Planctomycetes bacterium]|nr:hypothetical protein [Planctomycetota bacterium]